MQDVSKVKVLLFFMSKLVMLPFSCQHQNYTFNHYSQICLANKLRQSNIFFIIMTSPWILISSLA